MLADHRIRWYWPWLVGGALSLLYLIFSLTQKGEGPRVQFLTQLYLIFAVQNMQTLCVGSAYVLKGNALLRIRMHLVEQVPLADAKWKRSGHRWDVRWKAGRVGKAMRITLSPAFSEALAHAISQAQAEGAERQPEGMVAVGGPYRPIGRLLPYLLVPGALIALAAWTGNASWLVPIGLVVPLASLHYDHTLLLLDQDGLWVLKPGQEPHLIPLEAIKGIESPKRKPERILTKDPTYPEIPVWAFAQRSSELVTQLRRQLAGEPVVTAATPAAPPPGPQILRCTLCGRPVAELPPNAGSDAKSVHICELCGGKARVQAAETGYGLTTKEHRPL